MKMKYLDEYRDQAVCRRLLEKIYQQRSNPIRLMEVCGTHTMAIARNGIHSLLPPHITLLSGPGCPVCVTSPTDIDKFIGVARIPDVIVTTFGDLLRVPGSSSSLEKARADGADIRIVYSPVDSLEIAVQNPQKEVVFLGVGFETTAPVIAATLLDAQKRNLMNFSIISALKLVPPALQVLLNNPALQVDGFICPGHVSIIIGGQAYLTIVEQYQKPCAIAGFEPADILQAILALVNQIKKREARLENVYKRSVQFEGNIKARQIMFQIFEPTNVVWRGLGMIPMSGLKIRSELERMDAIKKFDLSVPEAPEPPGCICGHILSGIKKPVECPLFNKKCLPEHPVGPCMVSSEGTCAAYYKYLTK
ncbi:hydrogenase formation protein HypD [candidate division KSB1 bacterium]|nr:hydrogenase formation protein HypD [candidate division KSB1 bacterium]